MTLIFLLNLSNQPRRSCAYRFNVQTLHEVGTCRGRVWQAGEKFGGVFGGADVGGVFTPRAEEFFIAWAEQTKRRCADRRGHVHEAGIVADEKAGAFEAGRSGQKIAACDVEKLVLGECG